ncbi:MAG: ribose ABC transporter permease [Anaerolineae bacterium]|nr:ribose ABC transporter permease [Anaerolineae bacterium]
MIAAKTFPKEINWRTFFQRYGLLLSLILLCIVLSLASDRFLTSSNLLNVLRQSSINGIISIGMMLVILTRGIDLSVGSVLALSTVIGVDLLKNEGMPVVQAIGVCLLVGAAAGAVNGLLVSWLNIPPFIATLGMMTFARGAAKFYTDGQPISGLDQLGRGFRLLGTAEPLGIPMPIIVAGLVFLAGYILLNHIPFGRYIFGLGDNEEAAYLSGLPVRLIKMFVYVAAGALSALAGIILVGRLNSAQPTAGEMYEFNAIAAVVVGGTSFDGGEGTIMGTLIGVLIIGIIDNGLNLLDVSSFYQDITKGAVIALALLLHRAIR